MKKVLFLLLCFVAVCGVNAKNWKVTVSTVKYVKFENVSDRNDIIESSEPGNTVSFNVVADTEYEAQTEAINRCSGTCSSNVWQLEARNVKIGNSNKLFNKFTKTVPDKATAVEIK